ncbi:hypothetical protein ACLKA6_008812 [Drosophila palustris]
MEFLVQPQARPRTRNAFIGHRSGHNKRTPKPDSSHHDRHHHHHHQHRQQRLIGIDNDDDHDKRTEIPKTDSRRLSYMNGNWGTAMLNENHLNAATSPCYCCCSIVRQLKKKFQ